MLSHTQCESLFKFSLRMYKRLQTHNKESKNLVCSPFGIACALAIIAGGACNTTSKQIFALLNLKASKCRIQDEFSKLLTILWGYAPDITFHVANRIYSDQTFSVRGSYLALVEASYGASMKSVDFESGHESVQREAWVSEQTASRIQVIVPSGSVDADTALIHLNAICFRGFWQWPFRSVYTTRQEFRLDYKNAVWVNMIFQHNSFKMGHSEELCARALEIPYRGQKMSMVILLPDDVEGLYDLEEALTPINLSTLLASMKLVGDVEMSVPKFRIEHSEALRETLKDLGVKDLFTPGKADLSEVFETGTPAVSDVLHKTLVQVDEEGTEPEVATTNAVIEPAGAVAAQAVRFVVDHPFMFVIKMNNLDVILFLGPVRNIDAVAMTEVQNLRAD